VVHEKGPNTPLAPAHTVVFFGQQLLVCTYAITGHEELFWIVTHKTVEGALPLGKGLMGSQRLQPPQHVVVLGQQMDAVIVLYP